MIDHKAPAWFLAAHQTLETCAHPGTCGVGVHSDVLVGGVLLGFCETHGRLQAEQEAERQAVAAQAKEEKRKAAAEKRAAARVKAKAIADEVAAEQSMVEEAIAEADAKAAERAAARVARAEAKEAGLLPLEDSEEYGG